MHKADHRIVPLSSADARVAVTSIRSLSVYETVDAERVAAGGLEPPTFGQ
jgi:hypothetical protein